MNWISTFLSASFWSRGGYAILGALLVAFFAQIRIELDWTEAGIPITGQSFAVLLIGFYWPRPWGVIAMLLYLLLGGFGLPVFSGGAAGWGVFLKGSAGYLYGFVVAAGLMGWLAEKGWRRNFGKALDAMLLGTIVIIAFGLAWLTYLYGFSKALEYGLYPFVAGALIKIVVGALVVWGIQRIQESRTAS